MVDEFWVLLAYTAYSGITSALAIQMDMICCFVELYLKKIKFC